MKFDVFQINYTDAEFEAINKLGWDLAYKTMARVPAKLRNEDDATIREAWKNGYYELVATIDADDLERVFHIGNMGPESAITRRANRRMASISVGDILVPEDGAPVRVAGFGFEEL